MNTRNRLTLVVVSELVGIVAIVAVALGTVRAVQVTGPLYRHVLQGKDLLADVLPPPMYVVEAYGQALLLAREPDPARRRVLLDEIARLEKELGESRGRWEKELDDPALRGLVDDAYGRGGSFFHVVRGELLPAVEARDEAAVGRALDAVAREYQGQRTAIGQIAQRTAARNAADETKATSLVARSTALLLSLAVVILLGAGGLCLSSARRIARGLGSLARTTGAIREAVSSGDLSFRGDVVAVDSEFRPIVQGINETMEALVKPIKMTVDCANRISNGDIPELITDRYQGDFNGIKDALNRCIEAVNLLVTDAGVLAKAGVEGRLATRADASRHQGDFRRIIEGVNAAIDALVGHLDAMPAPAMVVDRDFKVRFMNAAALHVAGKGKAEVLGQRCSDLFRTTDCNTDRCACVRAMREDRTASSETVARPSSGEYEIAYSGVPIRDGGKVIGAFEVISDQTQVKRAMRSTQKVADFQGRCTTRVVSALETLSRGDSNVDATMEAGDQDTADAARSFSTISAAITRSAEAVRALTRDAGMLAEAAVAGQLSTRADASRHQGDFRKIVEGVNKTLDAVMAPINEAAGVLEQLSQRDLRARVTGNYQGDHAKIKDSVNATGEALHDALAQVAQAVNQVSSASTQIAASSQAVASGASEQAASLEETTSSIESVSGMTKQAADNAQQANQLAKAARTAATDGSAAVEQMQSAMGRIKTSAEGTAQIIKDINDIAFQTNLLALNAAVEAARAGEAGRGFAVVAEEVRSLALRAKDAATKTEELIRQSLKEAVQGEVTAKQVTGKLGEIASGVSKVSDIVAEIASGAQAQSTGIEQVTRAVAEMDKVTQQNAASAEESSSAASELSGQAEELASMVAGFQLASQVRAAAPVAPRRAPLALAAAPAARGPVPSSRRASPAAPRGAGNGEALAHHGKTRNGASAHASDVFPMEADSDLKEF